MSEAVPLTATEPDASENRPVPTVNVSVPVKLTVRVAGSRIPVPVNEAYSRSPLAAV